MNDTAKSDLSPYMFSYDSMGTTWKITIWDELDGADKTLEFFEKIKCEIINSSEEFDRIYSRFIENSLVSEISKQTAYLSMVDGEKIFQVPEDFMKMLRLYIDLYEITDRKLNPLIGHTISDLGYDAVYTLQSKKIEDIRETPDLLKTVRIIDSETIAVSAPALFDFGALGKGYFVDKIANILDEKNISRYLVDGSGDIFYKDDIHNLPIRVGMEDPIDNAKVLGVIELVRGSVCASGINKRAWGEHHHVIDPHSRQSTHSVGAVWVSSKSATLADAIATCLFFISPEVLSERLFELGRKNNQAYDFEYAMMNESDSKNDKSIRKIKQSAGLEAEMFSDANSIVD